MEHGESKDSKSLYNYIICFQACLEGMHQSGLWESNNWGIWPAVLPRVTRDKCQSRKRLLSVNPIIIGNLVKNKSEKQQYSWLTFAEAGQAETQSMMDDSMNHSWREGGTKASLHSRGMEINKHSDPEITEHVLQI